MSEIVKFRNGKYGVRGHRFCFIGPYHYLAWLSALDEYHWFIDANQNEKCHFDSEESARAHLLRAERALADHGTPV